MFPRKLLSWVIVICILYTPILGKPNWVPNQVVPCMLKWPKQRGVEGLDRGCSSAPQRFHRGTWPRGRHGGTPNPTDSAGPEPWHPTAPDAQPMGAMGMALPACERNYTFDLGNAWAIGYYMVLYHVKNSGDQEFGGIFQKLDQWLKIPTRKVPCPI